MIYTLLFLLTLFMNSNRCLSVIISVSALCFKSSILPSFFLKDSSYKTSPLVSAFTKRRRSSATLRCHYPLPTRYPTVVDRWFYILAGFYRGGSVADDYFQFAVEVGCGSVWAPLVLTEDASCPRAELSSATEPPTSMQVGGQSFLSSTMVCRNSEFRIHNS